MFFLVRSAFWLGVVFSAMPWNGEDKPHGPSHALQAVRSAAHSAAGTASAAAGFAASSYCAAHPSECLGAARKLTELFEKVSAEGDILAAPAAPQASLSPQDLSPVWRGKASAR